MAKSKRGKFVWYELMSTNPEAPKKFYTAVIGWKTQPFDNAAGMDYTMWVNGQAFIVFSIHACTASRP